MLPQKIVTKRDKRKLIRKHRGLIFVFVGLLMILVSLFYTAFLEKPEPILNPVSKNQTTEIAKIEQYLKSKGIAYKMIDIQNDLSYRVVLDSGSEVFLDPKKDILRQLSSLQLILSQLKIEVKTFKRLDFRFEKPIISF